MAARDSLLAACLRPLRGRHVAPPRLNPVWLDPRRATCSSQCLFIVALYLLVYCRLDIRFMGLWARAKYGLKWSLYGAARSAIKFNIVGLHTAGSLRVSMS